MTPDPIAAETTEEPHMPDPTDPPLTEPGWCPHTSVQRRLSGDLLCRACRTVVGRADDAQVVVTANVDDAR